MQKDASTPKLKKMTVKVIDIKHAHEKNKSLEEKSKAAFNLQFNSQEDNPEFTADFRTAIKKILSKMNDDPTNPENKILKLLVPNDKRLQEEIHKVILTNN